MELFERLADEQTRLAHGISLVNRVDTDALGLVAGVDTAYWTDSEGVEQAVCCVVVVDGATRQVVRSVRAQGRPTVPYRPGFLGFRELPLVEAAVARLDVAPDLFMFDGNGYLHPRRMGIATQASFALGRPTLGVAKTYHRVDGTDYQVPDDRVGAWTPIVAAGPPEVLGAVLRTRQGVKPVFVSCGNWIDLDTAVTVTLGLVEPSSRLPVPVRQADLATHQARSQARA
ncbi:MAG: endonuclease V [Micrococcales bacterium]|nr:endonuclease V [Micrococcales bacterium]